MNRTVLASFVPLFYLHAQDVSEQQAKLEHIRAVNLARAAALPSFVADEMAVRYKSKHVDPPQWQLVDTIESEIAIRDGGFVRQHTTVNGKPWNKPNLPDGFGWSVAFGDEIKQLFDPDCRTAIDYVGREEMHGKPALAYRFQSAPGGCFGNFTIKEGFFSALKAYNPARTGRFLVDDPGGNLIYFEIEAKEFPKWLGSDPFKGIDSWDYVKIGDATNLLPVATEMFGGFKRENLWHVTVEYKNHRHFEASTNMTFH
jgi:hypothetical protein